MQCRATVCYSHYAPSISNKVHNNGGIVIRGTSANTLVTGSVINASHVGIHVNYSTTTDLFGAEGGGIV